MEVRIYIDVLWFRTFLIEFLVCMFVNLWTKQNRPTLRVLLLVAAEASAQVLLFVFTGYSFAYAGGSLLLFLLLLFFLFRPGRGMAFLRLFLWSMAANIAAGGLLSLCQRKLPSGYWFGAGVCALALSVMGSVILEERRRQQDIRLYRVMLLNNGRSVEVTGLHDTGNRLTDPYVHAPVNILAESVAQAVVPMQEPCRLIPFCSVGEANGLLRAWTIDAMEWEKGRQEQVVVGVASDELFENKEYQLILAVGFRGLH